MGGGGVTKSNLHLPPLFLPLPGNGEGDCPRQQPEAVLQAPQGTECVLVVTDEGMD